MENSWLSVSPFSLAAPLGQAATQAPQPWHSASRTTTTRVTGSLKRAPKGQTVMHTSQPLQRRAFTSETTRPEVSCPRPSRMAARSAAAWAWAMVSEISRGEWARPQT